MINIRKLLKASNKLFCGVFIFVCINCLLFMNTVYAARLKYGIDQTYLAPELQGISGWLNSQPLSLQALKGKVVLLDFWSYGCPYCIYSLPHLIDWYNKYSGMGLVIIGVHSPEYPFEANEVSIQNAINKYGIPYPVALDNDNQSWHEYNGLYYPTTYLIDKNGYVVYRHIGQGGDNVIENNIRVLLSKPYANQ